MSILFLKICPCSDTSRKLMSCEDHCLSCRSLLPGRSPDWLFTSMGSSRPARTSVPQVPLGHHQGPRTHLLEGLAVVGGYRAPPSLVLERLFLKETLWGSRWGLKSVLIPPCPYGHSNCMQWTGPCYAWHPAHKKRDVPRAPPLPGPHLRFDIFLHDCFPTLGRVVVNPVAFLGCWL